MSQPDHPPPLAVSRGQLRALRASIRAAVSEELSSILFLSGALCHTPTEYQVDRVTGVALEAALAALSERGN